MAIKSFSISFLENFLVRVVTSSNIPIQNAQVTVTTSTGTMVVDTDSSGGAFFYIPTSETITISVLYDAIPLSDSFAYTFTTGVTTYSFEFPLPLRYTQSNSANYFRWYKPNEAATLDDARDALIDCVLELTDSSTKTRKPTSYISYSKLFFPQIVIVQSVPFSFYANLDTLEDNANFNNWRVDIVTEGLVLVETDVFTLTKDVISGSDYRFYAENATIPIGTSLKSGTAYRLCIIDTTDNTIVYLGELFEYRRFQPTYQEPIKSIKYRNNRNILNYNYAGLPSFYNEYYIKVHSGSKRPVTGQQGYEVVDGSFLPVRATTGAEFRFVTQAYGKEDHAAFNAVTLHKEFYAVIESGYQQFVRGSGDYSVDYGDLRNPIADGEISLQLKPSFNSNKLL